MPTTQLTRPSRYRPSASFSLVASAWKSIEDRVGTRAERARIQLLVDRTKWAIELRHEDAAHGIDDEHFGAAAGFVEPGATSGRTGWIVERAQQTRLALDENERLALVPTVVAERDRIGARRQQVVADRLGDAEAAG